MIEFQGRAPTDSIQQNGESSNSGAHEVGRQETAEERVQRLYKSQGGPLVGWLLDEAMRRGQNCKEMSAELGVTYGYIAQLRKGIRRSADINQHMADACAKYLSVPPVVIKLISGVLKVSDMLPPHESEEQALDRAIRRVQQDPQIRCALPHDLSQLPLAAKKAVVLMYAEVAGQDMFGHQDLPNIVRSLQRAALFHDENESAALQGSGAIF